MTLKISVFYTNGLLIYKKLPYKELKIRGYKKFNFKDLTIDNGICLTDKKMKPFIKRDKKAQEKREINKQIIDNSYTLLKDLKKYIKEFDNRYHIKFAISKKNSYICRFEITHSAFPENNIYFFIKQNSINCCVKKFIKIKTNYGHFVDYDSLNFDSFNIEEINGFIKRQIKNNLEEFNGKRK